MNAPNRYELFVLDDGEKAVEVTEDTKLTNAATIKVLKQDHTLANMLRAQLLANPAVTFAGYKVPHPLHPYFLIKLQTDGSLTPSAALEKAATELITTLNSLENKFKREFSLRDVNGGAGGEDVGAPWGAGQRDYMDF
ncbi:unnamed protein product [Peniophora sp. CBMAI 1063]|nr:unnamed protein product [Peniophora sp. CBMAI 1063]